MTTPLPIRTHLLLFAAAIVLPLVLLSGFVSYRYAREAQDKLQQTAVETAAKLSDAVELEIASLFGVLQGLATSDALQRRDYESFTSRAALALAGRKAGTVALRDLEGQILFNSAATSGSPLPRSNPVLRAFDRQIVEQQAPMVSDLHVGAVTGRPRLLVGVPVKIESAMYSLSSGLDPEAVRDLVRAAPLPAGWLATVLDRKGQIIARSRDHADYVGKSASAGFLAQTTEARGTLLSTTLDGVPVFTAYVLSPITGWRMVVSVPTDLYHAPIRSLWIALAALGLCALLCSLAAALAYGRAIGNGLRTLAANAAAVASGSGPLELTSPVAEHWVVNRSLNAAREELSRREVERLLSEQEQQRATDALRESEVRFRGMADGAPVMIWVTDPDGRCTYLNARWYEFTGQPEGAGEGFGWLDAVHADDRAIARDAFVSANAEHRDYRVDFRLRRADGAYRWAIDAAAARITHGGEFLGYIGSVIDIEDRRESEARLALSEQQLRLATEAAEVGLWDVDVLQDTMFWPARVKAMFGISPDVPVAMKDFFGGVHPDDLAHTAASYAAATDPDRRALYDVEYRTIGKEDGVIRWVAAKGRALFDENGVCTRVLGTAIEITERKASEVRLQELNAQLEQRVAEQTAERNRVWEMSDDLFAIMGFDGFLKAINPAWQRKLGRDLETLLKMPFPEQVHPNDQASIKDVLVRLRQGETVTRFEDRLLHADGTWRCISWTLVPEGEVFYAVGRDITAEKVAAQELENTQEALRQSQKMEAMGQLTGGVAHDFNNLLTPIMGSLDLLQRKQLGGEREQRLIGGAMQSAERAKVLVQRLLAFARRQPLQAAAVDIADLVSGIADLVASTSGPNVQVQVHIPEDLPAAKADANQLEMALLNLSVNARDAMPNGGTLLITALPVVIKPGDASDLRPGGYVCLSVADSGSGMDEETRRRAVEPFFSTKGLGKGTGLGLSMVHGLAAQLGGTLRIESAPGAGTTIELWLPTSEGALSPKEAAPPEQPAARGVVLLVDDEDLVRAATADMLLDVGYEVVQASSGQEALRLVAESLKPDLLVTDHLMPGQSGTELAAALRQTWPNLPVLIISGYAENTGIPPELPRLTKPFRQADLLNSLAGVR